MASELLLDTGALVSLLDKRQRFHVACVGLFESWEGAVVSTEAVLTEATHLLGRVAGGRAACVEFFTTGAAVLVPPAEGSLRRSRELLRRYDDLPMDYADSTLVALAEELDTRTVFTLDWRDFGVYRIHGRHRFTIVPELPDRG